MSDQLLEAESSYLTFACSDAAVVDGDEEGEDSATERIAGEIECVCVAKVVVVAVPVNDAVDHASVDPCAA